MLRYKTLHLLVGCFFDEDKVLTGLYLDQALEVSMRWIWLHNWKESNPPPRLKQCGQRRRSRRKFWGKDLSWNRGWRREAPNDTGNRKGWWRDALAGNSSETVCSQQNQKLGQGISYWWEKRGWPFVISIITRQFCCRKEGYGRRACCRVMFLDIRDFNQQL